IYDENEYDFKELKNEEEVTTIATRCFSFGSGGRNGSGRHGRGRCCLRPRDGEVEIKINEIITSHVNIKVAENKNDIQKLTAILDYIIDEVDECLKLLGVEYNDKDGLLEKLKKLVNASFASNFDKNMDKLTEACYGNKKQELNNDVRYKDKAFVPKPDSNFGLPSYDLPFEE
ncbi:662_t:CDS:2, partial [Dentiscutata erythropus]